MHEQHYNQLPVCSAASVTINSVVPHMSFSELKNQTPL